jgi:two-component system, sensor histidine kinase RegB
MSCSSPRAIDRHMIDGASRDEIEINLRWLVRLRWATVAGQLVTILGVQYGLHIPLPLLPLFSIVGLEAVSNVAAPFVVKRPSELVLVALVALDLFLFTGMLYFTGGPSNPFSFLYLIYLALAALVLRPVWTWALVALTLVCSGLLFVKHVPLPMDHGAHSGMNHAGMQHEGMDHSRMNHAGMNHSGMQEFDTHLKGMWVALGVSATFIVYFLSRLRRELNRAREKSAESAQLAALGTLATGAAHELASPLSTIAVAATELERSLTDKDGEAMEDVQLVKKQVARCREVLQRLAADAGQTMGEGSKPITLSALLSRALEGLEHGERAQVKLEPNLADRNLDLPVGSAAQAVRSVVENALDAAKESVTITGGSTKGRVRIVVVDDGPGMTAEVLRHAREPFFTTKEPGRGMGLGLFLAESITSQLGGALTIDSSPGRGTKVTLELPERSRA